MEKDKQEIRQPKYPRITMSGSDSMVDEGVYNPFEHRDMTYAYSAVSAMAHLLKSSIGTGLLAMPLAFKNSGLIFGIFGTAIASFICAHCIFIFVTTSQEVCRKAKIPSLGFSETVGKVFEIGPPSLRKYSSLMLSITSTILALTYAGVNGLYIVYAATSLQAVVNDLLSLDWKVQYYVAIILLPCFILGEIRRLKYLVPFSALANVCILVTFLITLWYMITGPIEIAKRPMVADWRQFPLFFSTVIFAVDGIATMIPVENSMRKPQQFSGVFGILSISMTIVTIMHAAIGFLGYARFGDTVKASVTLNLPEGELGSKVAQMFIGIGILFTFGLKFFVPIDILWRAVKPHISKTKRNMYQIFIRAGCVLALAIIAAVVPNVNLFIGLIGAIFVKLHGLFFPALIDTIFRYPDNLGVANWILIKNLFLMLVSLLVLISGTVASIQDILNSGI